MLLPLAVDTFPHMKTILLTLIIITLFLVSCNQTTAPDSAGTTPVQVQRLNVDYGVGQPRVSFALFDGPEPLTNVAQVTVTAVTLDDENAQPSAPIQATSYADYEIPYWVIYPEIAEPGLWGLTAVIQLENGDSFESQFALEVQAESAGLALGDAAPASQNKTIHSEPDLQKLSSGNDPNPNLYQMTVAEALASGKPTVVAFATPGLCQTKWCSPVLDSVTAVQKQTGEAANFIHIEVYDDFQDLTLVPQMAEWGLETEPWVYVLDSNGRVTDRFGGPLSARELTEALQPLLP